MCALKCWKKSWSAKSAKSEEEKNMKSPLKNAKKVFKNIETKYSKSVGNNLSKCWKIFEINAQENVEKMFLKVLKKSVKMLENIWNKSSRKCWKYVP